MIQEAPHTVVVKQIPTPQLAAETDCIVKGGYFPAFPPLGTPD